MVFFASPNANSTSPFFKEGRSRTPDQTTQDKAVMIKVKKCCSRGLGFDLLNAAPRIFWWDSALFLMRQMQAGGNQALSFREVRRAAVLSGFAEKATF